MVAGHLGGLAGIGAGLAHSDYVGRLIVTPIRVCNKLTHAHSDEVSTMARVQLVVPDADKDRFVHQARREGMSLSAWLRAAARDRLAQRQSTKRFRTVEDVKKFFERVHAEAGPGRELDWDEHLAVINESKSRGLPKP